MGRDPCVGPYREASCTSAHDKCRVFVTGLEDGGPAGLVYGYIFCWIGYLCIIASIAELASMISTSSGQYHWVYVLAPARYKVILSYFTGEWRTSTGRYTDILNQARLAERDSMAGWLRECMLLLWHPYPGSCGPELSTIRFPTLARHSTRIRSSPTRNLLQHHPRQIPPSSRNDNPGHPPCGLCRHTSPTSLSRTPRHRKRRLCPVPPTRRLREQRRHLPRRHRHHQPRHARRRRRRPHERGNPQQHHRRPLGHGRLDRNQRRPRLRHAHRSPLLHRRH